MKRGLRKYALAATALVVFPIARARSEAETESAWTLTPWAVAIGVPDVDVSADFFTRHFGYSRISTVSGDTHALLRNGEMLLLLNSAESAALGESPGSARTTINFVVSDLRQSITRLSEQGVSIIDSEPVRNAIGYSARFRDPAGNEHYLMQLDQPREGIGATPSVFNVGVTLTDIHEAESFYANKLGLDVYSRDYLPRTLPFQLRGAFSIVVHGWAERSRDNRHVSAAPSIVFSAADVAATMSALSKTGIPLTTSKPIDTPIGPSVSMIDPSGNVHQIVELNEQTQNISSSSLTSPLDSLSWIAGDWISRRDNELLEERWSAPRGDSMVGTFRWLRGGKVWLFEFMTIHLEEGRPVFRLKHFNATLKGWEAADESLTYPLKSQEYLTAIFENPDRSEPRQFIFERTADYELIIRLRGYENDRLTEGTAFRFTRETQR